ncbi:hypothetical protein [Sulfuricurvum sp.]|uniref:hypothetical protein n=1 Tax=Sulfuricurvum sp. TaxID=2025608 RepID=UPI003BB0ADAB
MLDEILPKNLYALDFTMSHYSELLSKLSVAKNEDLFNDKKGAIHKALVNYFIQTYQKIDLSVSFKSFTLKKHFIDPSRPESFDRMAHQNASIILDVLKRKEEFLPLPYLVSIPTEIRNQIMENFIKKNENMETARSITRQQIDSIFSLDERDITFFIQGKISIRYYTPPQKFPAGIDKRFAGASVEVMEEMYQHYFPEGAWSYIEPILGEVISDKLNFSVIDNSTFTKTFIPVFRSMLEILLLDIVTEEDREKIEGQTGFILRQYFHEILLYTAKNLLEFIENRDKNAETFVKYFADEIIIDANGNKIQKHAITDRQQQKWNFSSVLSVMMQYKQSKIRIASQKEAILAAQERVSECQADIALEKKHKHDTSEKIDELETMISENDRKVIELSRRIKEKRDESSSAKSDLTKANELHEDLIKMKKNHDAQLDMVKNRISNKMSELAQRHKKLEYEKTSLKNILEQSASIHEMYELIAEAISLVLAKR